MLQFDGETGKITYKGREVGEHIFAHGRSTVRLNIEYETGDDWIVPLCWLAIGLAKLPENQPSPVLLTLKTSENGIKETYDVTRLLLEKQVKRSGYVWDFHKSDADPWPSPLHGHDYEKGLKLDAITGEIYDTATRERCKVLKRRHLKSVQQELRQSKDFADSVRRLIDNE
jgi:hypothetical protein